MKVIHVLRKPLSEGTVASNVLKHGTGGINIDASRVGTTDNLNGGAYAENASERHDGAENWRYKRGEQGNAGEYQQPSGRWPANVILQHLDGCRCDGVKKVRGGNDPRRKDGSKPGHNFHGFDKKHAHDHRPCGHSGFSDKDGKETVADWICEPGCPVARLDADSLAGGMHSAGSSRSAKREAGKTGMFPMDGDGHRFGDTGGASRFYKQIGGSDE